MNDYAYLKDSILYTKLPNGKYQLSSIPSGLNIDTLIIDEGTYRIEDFAGSMNKFIEKIVFPDSLKTIGNYAFYKFENLKEVEFKSFTAPTFEDAYNKAASLVETDPGYDLLHKYFDLFGYELYYYTFIDLVGKREPIKMILPANTDIEGYDSIVYQAYFGTVENATRSTYQAMHKNMITFLEKAEKINDIEIVNLSHEKLINDAITAYNAIKQDPTIFGIDLEDWNNLVDKVFESKTTLMQIKLSKASLEVQNLQQEINNLPTTFNINLLDTLKTISNKINNLKADDKLILDLTNYNNLVSSYNEYIANLEAEIMPTIKAIDSTMIYVVISTIGSLSVIAMVLVSKKFLFK